MAVIFDLDQTLIDSSIAESFRNRRALQKVYSLIPKFNDYEGIDGILDWLADKEIPVCIVTNSPKSYCIRVVTYFAWSFDGMVCYHDTKNNKPDPEPITKSLELLGVKNSQAVSVGDEAKDIIASKRAGVHSIAVTWGANDIESLLRAGPDEVCSTVDELKQLLYVRFD